MASDKGVRANPLDRHFGLAGRGVHETRFGEIAERRAKLREQRKAVADLAKVQATKPLKPPGRSR